MGKWRAGILLLVHLLIALHIAHWLSGNETLTPLEPSEAMDFARRSYINAGFVFFAAMILLTAFFGRWFCGWGCHVLALQDLCRHWLIKLGIRPRPLSSRWLAWVPTLAFLYMFVWPLAFRWWAGESLAIQGTEMLTRDFWATFPGWIIGSLTLLICGFATVYFLGAKGFCTYACPYGAAFAAVDRVAPIRIRVTDACNECGHCTAVCSSNVRVHEEVKQFGMVTSAGCMKCMDCVATCPNQALYVGFGAIPLTIQPRDKSARPPKGPKLNWRDELILLLAFVITFLSIRGLFGVVPFLMALGTAAICAYMTLTAWHLRTLPTVARFGMDLRSGGVLTARGRQFLFLSVLQWSFIAYGGLLQWTQVDVERAQSAIEDFKPIILSNPEQVPDLPGDIRTVLEVGTNAAEALDSMSLAYWFGNSARQAWSATLLSKPELANQAIDRAVAKGELPYQMLQLRAYWQNRAGKIESARATWAEVIAMRPQEAQAYLALGLSFARGNEIARAQATFDQGLAYAATDSVLLYNSGLSRAMLGDHKGARARFEQAIRIAPNYIEAIENLAGLLASSGEFAESAREYAKAITLSPNDSQTRVLYAMVLLELGQASQARAQLQRAVELNPVDGQAWSLLQSLDDS